MWRCCEDMIDLTDEDGSALMDEGDSSIDDLVMPPPQLYFQSNQWIFTSNLPPI